MKLYYSTTGAEIFQGDAGNLDQIEAESVDMILTDPPYGIAYETNHRVASEGFGAISSDDKFPYLLMKEFLYEAHRVLKKNTAVYIFTRWDVYPKMLPLVSEVFTVRNVLCWVKDNWSAGDLKGNYARRTEWIIYATKGRHILNGGRDNDVLCFKRVSNLTHPTEKPVSLLAFIISKSCPKDGIVLDPFCGSGSTLEAALQYHCQAIGVEREEKWLPVARRRLERRFLPMMDLLEIQSNFQLELA